MQKDINTRVLENLFGKFEVEKQEASDSEMRRGFYVDSFYVTGMTYREYLAWSKRMSIHRPGSDIIFAELASYRAKQK